VLIQIAHIEQLEPAAGRSANGDRQAPQRSTAYPQVFRSLCLGQIAVLIHGIQTSPGSGPRNMPPAVITQPSF
jgi:hypothetical protein